MVPKKTILLAATALKPLPLMVTVIPTGPEEGLKELTTGCAMADKEGKNRQKHTASLYRCKVFFI
jgi:hypothetical protein